MPLLPARRRPVPVLLSLDRGRGGTGTARPSLGLERSWPPGGLLAFRVWSISSFLLPVMSVVWSRACPSLPLAPGGLTVADSPPRPQTGRREPPASVLTHSAVFPAHSCFSVGFPFCLNLLTSHILQTSITCFSNIKYFLMFHSVHITSSYLKTKTKNFLIPLTPPPHTHFFFQRKGLAQKPQKLWPPAEILKSPKSGARGE